MTHITDKELMDKGILDRRLGENYKFNAKFKEGIVQVNYENIEWCMRYLRGTQRQWSSFISNESNKEKYLQIAEFPFAGNDDGSSIIQAFVDLYNDNNKKSLVDKIVREAAK